MVLPCSWELVSIMGWSRVRFSGPSRDGVLVLAGLAGLVLTCALESASVSGCLVDVVAVMLDCSLLSGDIILCLFVPRIGFGMAEIGPKLVGLQICRPLVLVTLVQGFSEVAVGVPKKPGKCVSLSLWKFRFTGLGARVGSCVGLVVAFCVLYFVWRLSLQFGMCGLGEVLLPLLVSLSIPWLWLKCASV